MKRGVQAEGAIAWNMIEAALSLSAVMFLAAAMSLAMAISLAAPAAARAQDPATAPWPVLTGPYFGQRPPGATVEVFAPGLLSPFSRLHGRIIFSPDGREIFWTNNAAPVQSRWVSRVGADGAWTRPEASLFSVEHSENTFCYSPDGTKLVFGSHRPLGEGAGDSGCNLWYRVKTDSGWGAPKPLGPPVNTDESDERGPWMSADGTLYFTRERMTGEHQSAGPGPDQNDIFSARFVNGAYEEPVRLGPEVNSEHHEIDPVVAPDGSFLIFASNRPGGWGPRLNLYVSFRTKEGGWTKAQCISGLFGIQNIWFPSLSPDGKYLFFCGGMPNAQGYTDSKYFWVDTKCLDPLRPGK